MNHGTTRLATLPFSARLIREIHAELMRGVRGSHLTPGEFRRTQNWIGPSGCTLSTASFVPPPPEVVADSVSDLEKYLHNDRNLPTLIQIGLAHAQFETIHPFLDGNGRVGRLLIAFLLMERGVLSQPVLYLSHFLKRHRQQYYELLQAVRDDGRWEDWLRFFLTGVAEVSNEGVSTARSVLALREEHRTAITDTFGRTAANGHRVLDHLYRNPIVSVNDVAELTGASFPAANQLVGRLEGIGVLVEITGYARHRRFRYEPYVRLFLD
jgi:Fic family protein